MAYVDGYVVPVPLEKKQAYIELAEWMAPIFKEYGAIEVVPVSGSYVLDTGHIVAFESSLTYSVKTGGMKSLLLSGEGLVCHFTGQGKLWYQTRAAGALARFLHAYRPAKGD